MGKGFFLSSDSQDSYSLVWTCSGFFAPRAMGHSMDGAGASRVVTSIADAVSGTNSIYALYHASVAVRHAGHVQRYYFRWRETTRDRINPALWN